MRWPPPADWPMAGLSRLVACRPHRWHVQEAGAGPTVLLIHGAGGATQSFRALFPLLAQEAQVIAVDLPGQGFSRQGTRGRLSPEAMAADLAALLGALGARPALILGHSAGAALALRLGPLLPGPPRVLGVNGALDRFRGLAGVIFPLMARALAAAPFAAGLLSSSLTPQAIGQMLRATGSAADPEGARLYVALAGDRDHIAGTLGMMAQWDLGPLIADLPGLDLPVHLVAGTADRIVPPEVSRSAAARIPGARMTELAGLGHLAHEEAPERILALIRSELSAGGSPPPA